LYTATARAADEAQLAEKRAVKRAAGAEAQLAYLEVGPLYK
jgi:hypothetical protein